MHFFAIGAWILAQVTTLVVLLSPRNKKTVEDTLTTGADDDPESKLSQRKHAEYLERHKYLRTERT